MAHRGRRERSVAFKLPHTTVYTPLRLSFTGPYCFICHHGMQNAIDPEERTSYISCNTPLFSVIFWHVAGLVLSYISIARDTEWTSRHLAHWTRQALVPNVSEHVILPFGANGHRGPYQSHSSVTAIRLGPQKIKSNKGFNRNKGKK